LETGGDMIDDRSSSSSEESEESDGEHQGKVLNVSTALTSRHKLGLTDAELGIDILIRRKGHYDYDVRSKRGRERMYPVLPSKRNPRNDDFGDVIRPEDYLRAEERENMEGQDTAGARTDKELVLGQKRRWNEVATQLTVNGRAGTNGTKRRKSDDEGLFSDPSQMGTDGAAVNGSGIKDLSDSDDEMEETDSGPMKAVFATKSLRLHLRIAHVDFSGLHDKRSMQMLIPMIRPRKLVLVGGDQSETLALAAECKKLLSIGTMISADTAAEVLTPLIGQTLDASVDTNAWNVKLSFSLRKQLHWQNVGGLGVVPLTSHLSAAPSAGEQEVDSRAKRVKSGEVDVGQTPEPPDTNGSIETVPLLDIVPANKAAATRIVARPFHVGDLRLSDLRKMMQSQGYAAEFRGEGTLLVNGMVAVRKSAVGKVEVETVIGIPGFSVIDPTFDDVRRRIYEGLLAVMSGS
jgi:cleavage and polyadenylation specificity factor subunit 2